VTAYQFVREHKNRCSIRETAGVFGASSAAYYRWTEQGVWTGRKERDAELPEGEVYPRDQLEPRAACL
jgi:hypothetical protein